MTSHSQQVQLAVGKQNCFSTLFYTPYTSIKTSAQNAPKCTIARQKITARSPPQPPNPLGRGYLFPRPLRGIPLPRPLRCLRRLYSRAFGARRSRSFSFFDSNTRVTDGRSDRQTDILPRHSPRYAYASRGKNYECSAGNRTLKRQYIYAS